MVCVCLMVRVSLTIRVSSMLCDDDSQFNGVGLCHNESQFDDESQFNNESQFGNESQFDNPFDNKLF